MRRALELAGDRDVVLDAQSYLQGWYEKFGFVRSGAEFIEDGIPHVPMRLAAKALSELPPGGVPDDDRPWDAWHPREIADRLAGVATPWYVAGGWAVDLFLGEQTRPHEDLEIAVPRAGFAEIRAALPELEADVVGSGHIWPLASPAFDVMHQTWFREPSTGIYRVDVFREPHDGDVWICRRDATIRAPYAQIVHRTPDGIPYLAPQIVLLFKAKWARDKDQADFAALLSRLSAAQRTWLRAALSQVHPAHAWIERLERVQA
jgi:hypothetical protein